jgi:hypothetical protein
MSFIMKKTLLTLAATLAFSNTYAINAIESLTVYQSNLKQNASAIWPGFSIGKYPMIIPKDIFNDGDSLYAFDLVSASSWQAITLQGLPVSFMPHDNVGAYAFAGNLSNLVNAKFFSLQNQPAIVMPIFLDFDDSSQSAEIDNFNQILLSDMYYFMYEMNDSPNSAAKRAFYNNISPFTAVTDSFYNPESFSLLALEFSVLQDYLKTKNPDRLKTFAAISQYRSQNLDSNSAKFETSIDNPFCFNYVRMKSQTFNGKDGAEIILEQFISELPSYISSHDMGNLEPGGFFNDYYAMLSTIQLMEQYALDTLVPDWKTTVESQNTPSTTLLLNQFPLSKADINSLTQAAKSQYGYAGFYQDISTALAPYLAQMQAALAAYQNKAGIEFIMKRNGYASTVETSDFEDSRWRIDSDTSLLDAINWIDIADDNMDFNASNMPAFMWSEYAADYLIRSKLGDDTTIAIDNNAPVTLAQFVQAGQSVSANQVTLKGSAWLSPLKLSITMTGPAANLSVVNGNIVFEYTAEGISANGVKKAAVQARPGLKTRQQKIKHMRNFHFPYVS